MAQEIYGDWSVLIAVRSWRPTTSAENSESVRQAFSRSPMKSIRSAARELELPPTTVREVLRKGLQLYAYLEYLIGERLNACLTLSLFSADVLGRLCWMHFSLHPTLTRLHKFLLPSTNWRMWWWIFSILSPVPSLSRNVQLCFNEPGYSFCLHFRSSNLIRVYLTHSLNT